MDGICAKGNNNSNFNRHCSLSQNSYFLNVTVTSNWSHCYKQLGSLLQPTGVTVMTKWGHCFEDHPTKVGLRLPEWLVCVCVCVCVCVYGYVCLQCVYLCVSCVCALAVGQALFKYASFSKNNCRQKRESSVTLSEPLNTSRGKQTNATVLVINMCGSYISTSSLLCLSTCYCTSVPLLKTDCGQHSTTCEEEEKKRKKEKQKNKHIIYCLI